MNEFDLVEEWKINRVFFEDLNYYYPELENKIEKEVGKKVMFQFFEQRCLICGTMMSFSLLFISYR
jgi:hypothetical protein